MKKIEIILTKNNSKKFILKPFKKAIFKSIQK